MMAWAEMPRSPGHIFYDKPQAMLIAADFDRFVETQCAQEYTPRRGRRSLPPGRDFRMLLVGYFEGIDSERGLEWRCADRPFRNRRAKSVGVDGPTASSARTGAVSDPDWSRP